MDDGSLLRAWGRERSEGAFAELVRRHMGWVYATCRRLVGDAHLAEDVAQAVFVLLAQKAPELEKHAVLAGWLYRTAQYAAANARRRAANQRHHERAAARPDRAPDHGEAPAIDEALGTLRLSDREAILLRYHQGMSLAEVGAALGISEDGARKRVDRAVGRLRAKLAVAVGVLLTELTLRGTEAAPAELVRRTVGGVAHGGALSADRQAIVQGVQAMMRRSMLVTYGGIAALVAVLGVAILMTPRLWAATNPPAPLPVQPVGTPETAPARAATAGEVAAVSRANGLFAVELYKQLAKQEGNLAVGTQSVSTALGMASAAARGKTEEEMLAVTHLPADPVRHVAFSQWTAGLQKLAIRDGFALTSTNGVWLDKSLQVEAAFANLMKKQYKAELAGADFVHDPAAATRTINAWIAEQTEDRIRRLLSPGTLDDQTRAVLVNTVYFKAKWERPFDPYDTYKSYPWRTSDDPKPKPQAVPMMVGPHKLKLPYAETDDFQFLLLPYKGNRVAMGVILPKKADGLAAVEARLTGESFLKLLGEVQEREVILLFPRFRVGNSTSLKEALAAMGMRSAFDARAADLTGLSATRPLSFAQAVHEAIIDVGEEGTEAVAATAFSPAATALPMAKVQFTADHPFLFCIVVPETKSVLFMGRLVDPSAGQLPVARRVSR